MSDLPPYRFEHPCEQCGNRRDIRVHYCPGCAAVIEPHFHRLCPCGHTWLER